MNKEYGNRSKTGICHTKKAAAKVRYTSTTVESFAVQNWNLSLYTLLRLIAILIRSFRTFKELRINIQ